MTEDFEYSPEVDWALSILERARPEAARIIRLRLTERPNMDWVANLRKGAEIIEGAHASNVPEKLQWNDVARQLRSYAREIIGVNSFMDTFLNR